MLPLARSYALPAYIHGAERDVARLALARGSAASLLSWYIFRSKA